VIFRQVFESLEAAAPSYDPSTFSIDQHLIPHLIPIIKAEVAVNRFLHLYSVGFAVWVSFEIAYLSALSPFFYPHITQLLTLWRRVPSSRMSISGPSGDPSTNYPGGSGVKSARVRRTEYMILSLASTAVYLAESIVVGELGFKDFELPPNLQS